MPQVTQIIRDVITINSASPTFVGLQPGDTLRLIAREVNLTETRDLKGVTLEVYASAFTASNGAIILNQGTPGATGPAGGYGPKKLNTDDGSDGERGGHALPGTEGGVVKIFAASMSGLNISVKGGDGGNGGVGGRGGDGNPVKVPMTKREVDIYLSNGGQGGQGGPAAIGGRGGGRPGLGGEGGEGGHKGTFQWIPVPGGGGGRGRGRGGEPIGPIPTIMGGRPGNKGPPGDAASEGPAGIEERLAPSPDEFWNALAVEPFAKDWAKYRHAVGEYFFRCYVPGVADRDGYLGRAVDEFTAALRLNPAQTDSTLRREEIWNNMNPLSLPRDFNVIPNFKEYIGNLTSLGNLHATFASIGSTLLLKSSDLQVFRDLFQSQKIQSDIRINSAIADLDISKQEEMNLDTALKQCQKMIDSVEKRIQKAKEDMKKKPATLLGKITNVAELAIAVSAVMAAVPTGGASLLAITPHFITLSKTVYENFQPVMKAVIDHEETETLKTAKDQLDKVKKDSEKIKATANKVTDLVKVIDKIKEAKTPDNSKLLELVQKGLELAYEYLLKQQDLQVAQMRTKALEQKLAAERELLDFHNGAIAQTSLNEDVIRQAGLRVIQAAVAEADILLDFAFRTQRSIEIYLLKDQSQYVYYDVGRVHPDVEANCLADPGLIDVLNTSYMLSIKRLLDPTSMWKTYQNYFRSGLKDDIRRLPLYNEPAALAEFRSTMQMSFSLDVATSLPKERYNTKIQAIGIAFIGATGQGDMVSCRIEHGGLYSQRLSDGSIVDTVLHARNDIIQANIKALAQSGFDPDSSPPLDEPQNSPLWGMGVGGLYTITVSQSELEEHQANFAGLTAIEVWIAYQFME